MKSNKRVNSRTSKSRRRAETTDPDEAPPASIKTKTEGKTSHKAGKEVDHYSRRGNTYRLDDPPHEPLTLFQLLFCNCSPSLDQNDQWFDDFAVDSNKCNLTDIFQKLFFGHFEKDKRPAEFETQGSRSTQDVVQIKDIERASDNYTHRFVSSPKEIIVGTTEIVLPNNGTDRIGKVVSFQNLYYTIVLEGGDTVRMPLVDVLQCVIPEKDIVIGETEIVQTCDGIDRKGKVVAFHSPYYTIVFEGGSAKQMLGSDVLQLIARPKEKEVSELLSSGSYDNLLKRFKEVLAKPVVVQMVCEAKKRLKNYKVWIEGTTLFWCKYSPNIIGVGWKKNNSNQVDFTAIDRVQSGINTKTFKLAEKGLKEGENLPEECCFSLTFLNSEQTLDFHVNSRLEQEAFVVGFNLMLSEAQSSKSRSSSMALETM